MGVGEKVVLDLYGVTYVLGCVVLVLWWEKSGEVGV